MMSIFHILIIVTLSTWSSTVIPDEVKAEIITKVNAIRSKGCQCGNEYMAPARELTWNETLFQTAYNHARDMYSHNYFSHFSSKGEDIGVRADKQGYYWQYIGENLGEGQTNFDEVLKDWIDSPSHCIMLMNPNVKEMAVAKYKRFWVQHFGAQVPAGKRRVR